MGLLRDSTSREKRAFVLYSTIAFFFVLLYLVLFPRPLAPEFTLVPLEATALVETKSERLTSGGAYFTLGSWEGYWNAKGSLERVQPKRPQSTSSGESVAWFDAPRSQVVVEGIQGTRFALAGEQFPFWSHERLFLFDENRLGLKAVSADGKILWTKHFSSLVTSLDSSPGLTVVGTLDGKVQVFGPKGDSAGMFQPGGSRLPVIYNVAVAPKGESILVLAGVDPKRFLVLERGGSEFRPVFHKPLKENRPWPTPLGFLKAGDLAYYEAESGLALLDAHSPDKEILLSTQGSPLLLETLPGGRLLTFIQKDEAHSALRVASEEGASILTLPFASQDLLLRRQGSFLMLGVDQTLLRFEVRIQ